MADRGHCCPRHLLRQEAGLSQESLADRAGLERAYVSGLERELYSSSLDMIEGIAEALIVAPEALLDPNACEPV